MRGLGLGPALTRPIVSASTGGGGAVSSAVLASTNGEDKSQFLNVSSPFLSWVHNANVGSACLVRATTAAANTKFHVEVTCDGFAATNGLFWCGFDNGSTPNENTTGAVSTANLPGGTGGTAGITMSGSLNGTNLNIYANGALTTSTTLAAAFAVGDALVLEVDTSAKTIAIYHYRAATGTSSLRTTVTLTTNIPAIFNFFGGGSKGTGTQATSDSATVNFGGQSNKMTPNTGFGIYG